MLRQTLFGLAVLSFTTVGALAQGMPDFADLAVQISKGRAENSEKMKRYSWKRRSEVVKDGDVQLTKLELVRYDIDGRLQTTTISEEKEERRQMRGIRGRMQRRAVEAQKDWQADLQRLLRQYSLPTTGKVLDFLEKATFGRGKTKGTIRIVGTNVVKPGDELVMIVEADSKELQKTTVRTRLEDDVVLMDVNHDRLASGLNYQARSIIRVPSKKVRMTVENFDYNRQ